MQLGKGVLARYFNFKLSQIVNIYKEILLIVREIS